MIDKIEIGKTYVSCDNEESSATVIAIHEGCVFFQWYAASLGISSHDHACVDDFKKNHNEPPKEKEKWYRITYQLTRHSRPQVSLVLFPDKQTFLKITMTDESDLLFFHMEEVPNQME